MEILLVEDNPADIRLIQEALKELRGNIRLRIAKNGIAALDLLHQAANVFRPDLILLDINLPGKNGLEVLAELKQDSHLKRIPVIVLSSSQDKQDIFNAYNHHANCYIAKPVELDQLIILLRSIEDFWFRVVQLPSN